MADSVVGLMIDSDRVHAVEVSRWRSKHPKVLRVGELCLPADLHSNGGEIDPVGIAAILETLWKESGFKSRRVVMAVDGRQALVRRTTLPAGSRSQLRRAAGFDIGELISYPLNEAIYDVAEISRSEREDAEWLSTMVVAIHSSTRSALYQVAKLAGLKVAAIHLSSDSLSRSFLDPLAKATGEDDSTGKSGEDASRVVAIVNVGETTTDVVIRDSAGPLFSRTLTAGVGETALNIADELESHLEGLSGHRSRTESLSETERRESAAQAGVATVVEGVRRTLSYYQSDLDSRGVSGIFLSGSRSEVEGLSEALRTALTCPVSHATPSIEWPDDVAAWPAYATSVGLVLCHAQSGGAFRPHRSVNGERPAFSLVPWETKVRQHANRRNSVGLGLAGILAAVLISPSLWQYEYLQEREVAATDAEAARDQLLNSVDSYDAIVRQREQLNLRVEAADEVLLEEIGFPTVLEEIGSVMPADSQITAVQMHRSVQSESVLGYVSTDPVGVLSLSGLVVDMEGVGRFVEQAGSATLVAGIWLQQSTYGEVGIDGEVGSAFSIEGVITEAAQPRLGLFDGEMRVGLSS